jgi:hypothetical protein
MKTEELQIIKDRCNATSIAPWVASIEGRDHESGSSFIMTGIPVGEDIWQEKRGEDLEIIGATNADLDFIANARQDIPALVAEIERLQSNGVQHKIIATDNSTWKKDETVLNTTVEIIEPYFEKNVWQTILKMNGYGNVEYKLYGQSSIQALTFALQHTKLQLMILIEDGYLWYDEPTNAISTKEESIEVLNAIYGRGTLLDKEHTKANIILTIKRLQNASGNKEEQNIDISYLKKMFADPNIIDYIYHSKTEMTAAEIYEKAMAYKPIQL